MTRIAVIGAGLSGLAFAQSLGEAADVRLFEKSRGYGGRMATRRQDGYRFDHGAQFFTAKSRRFQTFLQPFIDAGVVARWDARFVEIDQGRITARRTWSAEYPHYVGVPGMNALGRALGETLDVALETRVGEIRRNGRGWRLLDSGGGMLGEFDWVVSAIPARQALDLLPREFVHLDAVSERDMPGCYALMLGFAEALPLDWDAALVKDEAISWISVDSSKPGRGEGYTLVVHASNRWAEAHMETTEEDVVAALLDALRRVIGADVDAAGVVALQRWRYANPGPREGEAALVDADNRLVAIGDWCTRGRVEAACLSGLDAAARLRRQLRGASA